MTLTFSLLVSASHEVFLAPMVFGFAHSEKEKGSHAAEAIDVPVHVVSRHAWGL